MGKQLNEELQTHFPSLSKMCLGILHKSFRHTWYDHAVLHLHPYRDADPSVGTESGQNYQSSLLEAERNSSEEEDK